MSAAVEIRQNALNDIIAHAREEAPDECCGLLVGSDSRVDESVRTRNLEASPTRYQIDPVQHVALMRRLRGGPSQIVGVYHSHPHTSPEPSPSDLAEAFYPDFIYLIVSLAGPTPRIGGYQIQDGNFTVLPLVTVA
jgi:proteasome lid subunit RPN8/RPN11